MPGGRCCCCRLRDDVAHDRQLLLPLLLVTGRLSSSDVRMVCWWQGSPPKPPIRPLGSSATIISIRAKCAAAACHAKCTT